jgi:hypothetical protein
MNTRELRETYIAMSPTALGMYNLKNDVPDRPWKEHQMGSLALES